MAAKGAEGEGPEGTAAPSEFQASMGALMAGLTSRRDDFEDRSEEAMRAKLRAQVGERTSKREVDRFLNLMRERGNGSIAVAWRRYFDSDGDGELDFNEFCHALVELHYEGDVIRLWHDLANGNRPENTDTLGLEDMDIESAAALNFFGQWTYTNFGGPSEFFMKVDDDDSDSLTTDEIADGLVDLGLFNCPGLPGVLDSKEKVLANLYPLLDANGSGAISCEHLMFLETDKEKRQRVLRELARIREYGKDVGGAEPLKSHAAKMLHKIAHRTTQLGGHHWSSVDDPVAVGEPPMSPKSPKLSPNMSASLLGRMGMQDSSKRLFRRDASPSPLKAAK